MKKTVKTAAATLGIAGIIGAAGAYIFGNKLFKVGCSRYDDMKHLWSSGLHRGNHSDVLNDAIIWARKMNPKKVEIFSKDKLKLVAHIIEAENPRGSILLMHGFHSSGIHDFSLALEPYHNMGFNLILPDQRAHGESEGKYITYGVKEKEDCALWAKYIAHRYPGKPILFDGISMGASTVMLATGEDIPPEVCGVIADCGYTSPTEIFRHVIKNGMKLPVQPGLLVACKIAERRAKVKLTDCSVPEALSKNTLPIFIAHGEADTFVPCHMTDTNAEACKNCPVTVIKVAGADHGESYLVDKERYQKMLHEFIDDCLNGYYDRVNLANE